MTANTLIRRLSPVALSILIAACGSGGNTTADPDPSLGAANENNSGTDVQAPGSSSVSGRVADGYIAGATVCVDVNENESCDTDEPSAVTGAGGVYDLDIPPEAIGKPIVADIPAEAVDEDTGQPVGKALVFIAPADRPEFISPITTLVHQELRDNPALNVAEAESAVKTILGIDEQDISLFADYVSGSADTESAENKSAQFQYLHDTARVVASMMKDIEVQVESAAVSKGVDVAGSDATRRAIREIVRAEVRELLPDIAQEVARIVATESTTTEGGTEGDAALAVLDPARIAEQLRPADAGDDIEDRIQAVSDRTESVQADIRQLMTDGMYWMEFDCGYYDYDGVYEETDVYVEDSDREGKESLDDFMDANPDGAYLPECQAFYGKVQLDRDGSTLFSEDYALDLESGSWVADEDEEGDRVSDFSLVDGQWIAVTSDGPDGQVRFNDDGTAVITNDEGTMTIKAATRILDAQPVLHHFWDGLSDPIWFDLVEPTDLFAAGSLAHTVSIQQTSHPYVLFNYQPYDQTDQEHCAEYGDNCNVVKSLVDDQPMSVASIDTLLESSATGIDLIAHGAGFGPDMLMSLLAKVNDDGSMPTEGTVEWIAQYVDYSTQYGPDYEPGIDPDHDPTKDPEFESDGEQDFQPEFKPDFEIDFDENVETEFDREFDVEFDKELEPGFDEFADTGRDDFDPTSTFPVGSVPDGECGNLSVFVEGDIPLELSESELPFTEAPDCPDLATQTDAILKPADGSGEGKSEADEYYPETGARGERVFVSGWKLIEVQGQQMIEISLPLALRHGDDIDSEEALLLIEHEGFVRMGARLPDVRRDRVMTYNESAFTQLRGIVESSLNQQR